MQRIAVILAILAVLVCAICQAQQNTLKEMDFTVLKGPYLNQKPPRMTPEIFAPGIVSTEHFEHGITISPQGDEIYFTRRTNIEEGNRIFFMKIIEGTWTKPSLAPFAGPCKESSPNFSPDGMSLFFNSRRPPTHNSNSSHAFNVWRVQKKGNDWAEPEMIGSPVIEYFPMYVTQTNNGIIYFTGNVDRGIYRARFKNGTYDQIQRLPDAINSLNWAGHPFIDPEERYVIFDSNIDEKGTKNLYISFKNNKGKWRDAINMNQCPGFPEHAAISHVSFDGKYLFFSSRGDIYWVDARLIERIRQLEIQK